MWVLVKKPASKNIRENRGGLTRKNRLKIAFFAKKTCFSTEEIRGKCAYYFFSENSENSDNKTGKKVQDGLRGFLFRGGNIDFSIF